MKKISSTINKIPLTLLLLAFLTSFKLFSFDWPQNPDNFASFFGQLKGSVISNSLIFSEPGEVKASDDGKVLIYLQEFHDDTDFFPSTLGDALILSHSDNIITIYGNLNGESISSQQVSKDKIEKGETIAESGNSAWNEGQTALEFQVTDTKNNTSINPKILMPHNTKEPALTITGVVLKNRNRNTFEAGKQSYLPSGVYRIYRKRQNVQVPYKTRVSINGAISDEISYDVLRQDGNLLCVSGKKNYPRSILYPDEELQLMGEATFSTGKNVLQLGVSDFMGKETTVSFIINNY